MATEKALFTDQSDFKQDGIGVSIDPFLYYNADDQNGWTVVGTPSKVPGMKGNAESYPTSSFAHKEVSTVGNRNMISFFFKGTADDVGATSGWSMLFTNRGMGYLNYGFHLAMYNGELNGRVYGSNGSISMWSTNTGQGGELVQPDTIYHCIFLYDEVDPNEFTVWMKDVTNGGQWEVWLISGTWVSVETFTGEVSISDMPSSSSTTGSQYNWNGWIDEFMWWSGTAGSPATDMPTIDEIQTTYHDYILNANWIDWFTEPGSMTVGKNYLGTYNQNIHTWTSQTVDLGRTGFSDFGRVQINFDQPQGTAVQVFTRTSTDGIAWNDWIEIQTNGTINSPDMQFLQIKANFWTTMGTVTPKIMEVQVLDYPIKKRLTLTSEPLIAYRDLDTGLERMGELVNAYDIIITEEVKGEESLEFKMAINDPKRIELGDEPVEIIAGIGDKEFIIREITDKRDDSGKKYTSFFAESTWYELRDAKVIQFEEVEQTAYQIMKAILDQSIIPTGWTIYKVDPTIKRTIRGEWKSVLKLFREVEETFDAELQFDSKNRQVSLISKIGEDKGVRFYYDKNLKSIERKVDTFGLITRLYLYGKNGLTIESVNNNVPYLENTTWVDALNLRKRIRIDRFSDGRYTIPQNLKGDGQKMVDQMAKPNVIYALTVNDLSMLSGHEHESIGLGDQVYTVDTELLNLLVESRIMRRKYNVRQPWKTEVELNQPKKELADINSRALDDQVQEMVESDPLNTSDVQQMTVFNHLLNSRAEDGTSYWALTGTGIRTEIGGFSGDASWKVVGGYGDTNIMKQSIYGVSHRSAYTVSAYVSNVGTITRGTSDDAFVGVRVRVHYTEPDSNGKTYEDHFLAIPDITQEGGA